MATIEQSQYRAVQIYALLDPDNGNIRYIGKANDAARRYKGHIRDSNRRDTPVYRWIRKLASSNKKPELQVLLSCCSDRWQHYEKSIIESNRKSGVRLLNVADGGEEPFCDDATRSSNATKMNDKFKSDPRSARIRYLKCMIGLSIKSGHMSERAKEKLRSAAIKFPSMLGEYATL